MKKPFQFSMRTLFVLTACLCVTAWWITATIHSYPHKNHNADLVFVGVILAITALNTFMQRRH